MHNRKEGSLALLAAHGGGLLVVGQQWLGATEALDASRAAYVGVAMGFFGLGALAAYVALRHSGDAAHETSTGKTLYRWSERVSLLLIVGLLAQVAVQAGINLRAQPYDPYLARDADAPPTVINQAGGPN